MLSYTPAFAAAIASGAQVVTGLDVLDSTGAVISGGVELLINDGNVTQDARAKHRRTAALTLLDQKGVLVPQTAFDLLSTTAGHELQLWRGVVLPDGSTEKKSLGIFGCDSVVSKDGPDGLTIDVSGTDRSRAVARRLSLNSYTVQQGQDPSLVIQNLIAAVRPNTTFVNTAANGPHTTPFIILQALTDYWQTAQDIGLAFGIEVFFNAFGVCIVRPVPDPALAPIAWTYDESTANPMVLNLQRSQTNEGAPNGIIAIGQSSYGLSPVRGEAWDIDPASSTYSGRQNDGTFIPTPYGAIPEQLQSSTWELIWTVSQCQAAAGARLRQVKGAVEIIDFTSLVNPAQEVSDVVRIIRAKSGVNADYVLDRYPIPLKTDGTSQAVTRERHLAT